VKRRTPSRTNVNSNGVLSDGQRLVRKTGVVKFGSAYFKHERLLPMVGGYVGVEATDPWFNFTVVVTVDHEFLCYAYLIDPATGERILASDPDAAAKSMKR